MTNLAVTEAEETDVRLVHNDDCKILNDIVK